MIEIKVGDKVSCEQLHTTKGETCIRKWACVVKSMEDGILELNRVDGRYLNRVPRSHVRKLVKMRKCESCHGHKGDFCTLGESGLPYYVVCWECNGKGRVKM